LKSKSAPDQELIDWVRLARTDSVGPVTFAHLIARYGSASAALSALPNLARRGGRVAPLNLLDARAAEAELAAGVSIGARVLTCGSAGYPRLLAVLDPPPPLIWVLGDLDILTRRSVAIVGARAASAAGQRFAFELAGALGEAGYGVVSGMARGIDTAAHRGSLHSGTTAVLAGGVDDIYPPENASLYDLLRVRGCVVSERPPGLKARAADFPRRNRLISGLALGVVVVEAELRSGSLITARLAGEQGRDVFAVPGSPGDPRSRGANDLIRQGAVLVEDVDDILRVLGGGHQAVCAPRPEDWKGDHGELADDALRDQIAGLLSQAPTSIDALSRLAGAPVSGVLAALTELTIAGRAEMLPGGLAIGYGGGSR
jgi:DNA processing protein